MANSDNNLMRNLGRFFGHVGKAIVSDSPPPAPTKKQEVRRDVEEAQGTGPNGEKVTLRRTIVEEIEIQADTQEQQP